MSKPSPEQQVRDLLADVPAELTKPCAVERNVELAKALREYLRLYRAGETKVSLEWFYEKKLKPLHSGPSMSTVRRWVRAQ